jgi:hypothetical protein
VLAALGTARRIALAALGTARRIALAALPMRAAGQRDRLARVRFLVLPASR